MIQNNANTAESIEYEPCPQCDGSGMAGECWVCNGDGYLTAHQLERVESGRE